MKKIIIGLILAVSLLTGCGEGYICDYSIGNKIETNYIIIDKIDDCQYLVYDDDTKILYLANLQNNGGYGSIVEFSFCPYYVMNENNEPVVGVYNEEEE